MGRSDSISLRKEGEGNAVKYLYRNTYYFCEGEENGENGKGKGGKYL